MMRSLDNLDAGAVKACQSFQTLLKDDILGATLTVREAFAELNKNRCSNVFEQHRWASRTKFPPWGLGIFSRDALESTFGSSLIGPHVHAVRRRHCWDVQKVDQIDPDRQLVISWKTIVLLCFWALGVAGTCPQRIKASQRAGRVSWALKTLHLEARPLQEHLPAFAWY